MNLKWDGITLSSTLNQESNEQRQQLAKVARTGNWEKMVEILRVNPELVNTTRPDGKSRYAPLHQAAYGGAPMDVVKELIELGGWRTLRNADGKRPIDIARKRGHSGLLSILEPVYKRRVALNDLVLIQEYFHAVTYGRSRALVEEHHLRLPELEPLLEFEKTEVWFAVPGMAGGFNYWLEEEGDQALLITESWCRVVGGSGQRHEISTRGIVLVDEGFV